MPQFIWQGQSGCLLPILIIFNLFFGKLFFHSTAIWLSIEGALIFLFILKIHLFVRKINGQFQQKCRNGAIDVEGKVIEENLKGA